MPELKLKLKNELSVQQGCLMRSLLAIIPPSLRQQILGELHKSHPGVARMKAAARSHVWCLSIDSAIKKTTRSCKQCFKTRKAPTEEPLFPWHHTHVEFATYYSKHFLIMVDAHSKWPEVIDTMKTTTAKATANAMRNVFARYGLPAHWQWPTIPVYWVRGISGTQLHIEDPELSKATFLKRSGKAICANFQALSRLLSTWPSLFSAALSL